MHIDKNFAAIKTKLYVGVCIICENDVANYIKIKGKFLLKLTRKFLPNTCKKRKRMLLYVSVTATDMR